MSFEQVVKVPIDRVGVIVGKGGSVKNAIEEGCGVQLQIESRTGDVTIKSDADISKTNPFKAVQIVTAIARGFSPSRAYRLFNDEVTLEVVDLREYAGKSENALKRIKGRIIGLNGRSRRVIEELTGAYISVYGHTVTILGKIEEVRLCLEAVRLLAAGRSHRVVYNTLQRARSKAKLERLKLWEEKGL